MDSFTAVLEMIEVLMYTVCPKSKVVIGSQNDF